MTTIYIIKRDRRDDDGSEISLYPCISEEVAKREFKKMIHSLLNDDDSRWKGCADDDYDDNDICIEEEETRFFIEDLYEYNSDEIIIEEWDLIE